MAREPASGAPVVMSPHHKKKSESDCLSVSSRGCCLPPPDPEPTRHNQLRYPAPRLSKTFFFTPQFFRPDRATRSRTTAIHRCLLISEILSLILEFVRQFNDSSADGDARLDRNAGKRTLASLARTCRTLSGPALDVLWMRLDSLDPLIKVLPQRMWYKKRFPFVVRWFMRKEQWMTFRKYAERVRYLRGPSLCVPAPVQHNVIDAVVRYPKSSLPLLPNLKELVWSELRMSNLIDPSISLIKYFAGPGVTSFSLSLVCWPNHVSSELAVLASLPNLFPNLTSFTSFFPRSSNNDHSAEIGEIVRQWSHLRVLRSCALPQRVMDAIMSRQTLDTLSVELNSSSMAVYAGHLPPQVNTWLVDGNSAGLCGQYLASIHGSPTSFHLRIGTGDSTTADMEGLVRMLPTRLDKGRLRMLAIELTLSHWSTPASDSFSLLPALLPSLACFSGLEELDISTYCAAGVDDRGYEVWIAGLTGLTSLKLGVADVSRAKPLASIGAVMAILKACRLLKTLWIVFDASFPLPPGTGDEGKRLEYKEVNGGSSDNDGNDNEWRVTNCLITQLRIGYSPIGEDEKELEALARCLRNIMPRLEKIGMDKYPAEVDERWRKVQEMLMQR